MKTQLYKDRNNGKILGVCQGLADYFKFDPSLVRLAFAIGTLFWGKLLLIYILLAIILPDKTDMKSDN